jgi:hypothetical protein
MTESTVSEIRPQPISSALHPDVRDRIDGALLKLCKPMGVVSTSIHAIRETFDVNSLDKPQADMALQAAYDLLTDVLSALDTSDLDRLMQKSAAEVAHG